MTKTMGIGARARLALTSKEIATASKAEMTHNVVKQLFIVIPGEMIANDWKHGDAICVYKHSKRTNRWSVRMVCDRTTRARNIVNPYAHFNSRFGMVQLIPGFEVNYVVREEDGEIDTVITVPRSMILKTCSDSRITTLLHDRSMRHVEFKYMLATKEQCKQGVDKDTVFLTVTAFYSVGNIDAPQLRLVFQATLYGEDLEHFNRLQITAPLSHGFTVEAWGYMHNE